MGAFGGTFRAYRNRSVVRELERNTAEQLNRLEDTFARELQNNSISQEKFEMLIHEKIEQTPYALRLIEDYLKEDEQEKDWAYARLLLASLGWTH